MVRVFNPPPGWPKPEEGWSPPPGWKPDPSWPEPPQGWDFWIDKADDVGSSLFGGSALGSSLFSARDDDTSIDSYGSVSPSGAAHIPGAPTGPDFTVSNRHDREPTSMSEGVSQSTASRPSSPSAGSGYAMASTTGQGAGTQGGSPSASTFSPSATPGGNPNAAPKVGAQGGGGMVALGLLLIALGVGLSAFSFFAAEPGEEFELWWSPALIGVFVFVGGLVRMLRARAQRRQQLGQTGGGYSPSGHITQPGGSEDASGGVRTGYSSTLSMQNPNDPKNYKRR